MARQTSTASAQLDGNFGCFDVVARPETTLASCVLEQETAAYSDCSVGRGPSVTLRATLSKDRSANLSKANDELLRRGRRTAAMQPNLSWPKHFEQSCQTNLAGILVVPPFRRLLKHL